MYFKCIFKQTQKNLTNKKVHIKIPFRIVVRTDWSVNHKQIWQSTTALKILT